MIARATAASPAASTITSRANTCPSNANFGTYRAQATKFTFAAFSTSSTPINTPTAFRLAAMHKSPQAKSNAPRHKYGVSPRSVIPGLLRPPLGPGQIGRADQHDEQVHGDDLERQQVRRQETDSELPGAGHRLGRGSRLPLADSQRDPEEQGGQARGQHPAPRPLLRAGSNPDELLLGREHDAEYDQDPPPPRPSDQ